MQSQPERPAKIGGFLIRAGADTLSQRHEHRDGSLQIQRVPMTETWLQPNRRVLLMSLIPTAALAGVGVLLLWAFEAMLPRAFAWCLIAIAAVMVPGLLSQLRRPRIAYCDGNVLFNLRAGQPVAVPVEVVEAFFLGQGPSHLPSLGGKPAETVNLVARLSQKAPEWAHLNVKRALGNWCDSYVTIRGTWCEPLDNEVIRRLNRRLREVHESMSAGSELVGKGASDGNA